MRTDGKWGDEQAIRVAESIYRDLGVGTSAVFEPCAINGARLVRHLERPGASSFYLAFLSNSNYVASLVPLSGVMPLLDRIPAPRVSPDPRKGMNLVLG